MPYQFFQITSVNPNDTTGGGGCVCDPQRQIDCKPPYAVFPGNDMENIASPSVVICEACAAAVVAKCRGEILTGGEKHELMVVSGAHQELVVPEPVVDAESWDDDEDVPEL